jgi:tetratricopeptide (TPR) repeat protein/predicted transcriptional regulator
MEHLGGGDAIETLGRRAEFLDLLDGEPLHKRDMVERLDHSRSTVDRAIGDLTEAGFVERVTRGFVTTQSGRLAVARYRSFRREADAILSSVDVLEPLPPDQDLPVSLLTHGQTRTTQGSYRLLEAIADALEGASGYRAVLPRMVDSRHLRMCHARAIRDEQSVSIVAPSALLTRLKTEFPALLSELSTAPAFSVAVGETPPYGLLLVEDTDGPSEVLIVTYEDSEIRGFCRATDPETLAWAVDRFEAVRSSARELSDELADPGETAAMSSLRGDRLPPQLRTQGFVRIDDRYLSNRSPLSPSVSYRAGLGLPEVFDSQSVDRFDENESLTQQVRDRLRSGTDVALLGPPGSGKSTLCKRVAREWYEGDIGSVFYRESTDTEPFESVEALERVVDHAPAPTLIVVEDAVRREASPIFDAVGSFADSEDVVFLLDARETEWQEPLVGSVNARVEAFRREAVETVTMPAFDERECRRLVDRLAAETETEIDVPVDELLEAATNDAKSAPTAPAAIYLACHRLARYAEPLSAYEPTPTTLEEDVQRVHARLSEQGSDALDVGVLIALLSVAGGPIETAALETLAVADVVGSDVPGRVREELTGVALFPIDGDDERWRGPHESWAASFLEHHLDSVGAAAAHDRVGRCVSVLLSLADDADRRRALARRCGEDVPLLERIVRDPTGWAEDTVDRIFDVGRTYASLAPLFGRGAETAITIPEACTEAAERRGIAARASMLETLGDLSGAERAYERLWEYGAGEGSALRARAESQLGLAGIARQRGEFDQARAYASEALELAADLDAVEPEVRGHLELASIATAEGDPDRAIEALDDGEAAIEGVDAPRLSAALWRQRGVVARTHSEYEDAVDAFRRSLDRYERLDDRENVAAVRGYLGQVANERGDFSTAREQFLRGLERARNAGASAVEADLLKDLGVLAYLRDEYAEAERYFEQALTLAASLDDPTVSIPVRLNSALVATERGDYAGGRERVKRALATARDIDATQFEASAVRILTSIAQDRTEPTTVVERAHQTLPLAREIGDKRLEIDARQFLAWGLLHTGETDDARDQAEQAVTLAREIDHPQKTGEALLELARVERRMGEHESAVEHATESHRRHEETGASGSQAASGCELATIALEQGDPERAQDHVERAITAFDADDNERGRRLARLRQAEIQRQRGDVDAAESSVESVLPTVERPLTSARAHRERGALARERGSLSVAREHLSKGRSALDPETFPLERARITAESGRVAAARGEVETARERFETAIDRLESIGASRRASELADELATVETTPASRQLRED